jgi:hypothetical protein
MRKRFESDRDGRLWTSLDNRGGTALADWNADAAVAEAERVLAETEPERSLPVPNGGAPVMLSGHGTLTDTITVERRTSNRKRHTRQTRELSALAAAIADALPLFDELAEGATDATIGGAW